GHVYALRMYPYRSSAGNGVDGVVLIFMDVSELRSAQARIAEDLRRMTRLQELGTWLAGRSDARHMLDEVLSVAVEVTGADRGDVQRVEQDGALTIAAQQGFEPQFLESFARVDAHTDSL